MDARQRALARLAAAARRARGVDVRSSWTWLLLLRYFFVSPRAAQTPSARHALSISSDSVRPAQRARQAEPAVASARPARAPACAARAAAPPAARASSPSPSASTCSASDLAVLAAPSCRSRRPPRAAGSRAIRQIAMRRRQVALEHDLGAVGGRLLLEAREQALAQLGAGAAQRLVDELGLRGEVRVEAAHGEAGALHDVGHARAARCPARAPGAPPTAGWSRATAPSVPSWWSSYERNMTMIR